MRALVIGADGFAGRWLVRHLRDSGDAVVGVVGPNFGAPLDGADQLEQVDVRDGQAMNRIVDAAQPEVVFYLAGVSRQGERDDISAAVGVSVVGSMNTLMACAQVSPAPRLVFVSTGYVYRARPDPLDETSPIRPDSIYAAGKLVAEHGLLALGPDAGVEVVIARPFNHIGPGQADSFLVPTLARQVVAAAEGGDSEIRVADASVVRDFTDVRDVARAYRLLGEHGVKGTIYNIASGAGISVADLAQEMGRIAGVGVLVTSTHTDIATSRPSAVIGDAGKLQALGWVRKRDLEATLSDVLEDHRIVTRAKRELRS